MARVAGGNATRTKTDKPKGKKRNTSKNPIDRVSKIAGMINGRVERINKITSSWEKKNIDDDLIKIAEGVESLIQHAADLAADGFAPPAKIGKIKLAVGVHVYIKPKKCNEYMQAYSAEALDSMVVKEILGKKAFVLSVDGNGKSETIGLLPTADLTTKAP